MSDFFLADDLSGALDAAAAFHRGAERPVRVVLSAVDWVSHQNGEIVGVSTETRNESADRAAAAVEQAVRHGTKQGGRLLFKKIDSTLRGPVAAELAALLRLLPESRLLLAPANPAAGRTVRDGMLRVRGVPVAETEFARDPVCPVRESVIRRLLGEATGARTEIPETETEADLDAAVERMTSRGEPWIPIGSGGLARPVAKRARRASGNGPEPMARAALACGGGPVLLVGGSAHRATCAQAEAWSRETGGRLHRIDPRRPADVVAEAGADLAAHGAAALLLVAERVDSVAALRALVGAAADVIARSGVRRVLATGGETAFALAQALGVAELNYLHEIEPGASLALAAGASGNFLWAIKNGGFGDERSWLRIGEALRAEA